MRRKKQMKKYRIREKSILGVIVGLAPLSFTIIGLLIANLIFGIFGI
jgi:hypothetical protein